MSIRTGCTYDCPDACSIVAEWHDGDLRLSGDPDHPITRGHLCYRAAQHLARLKRADRLVSPRRRDDNGFRDIPWDEALDLAAAKLASALARGGPPSVAYIRGGGSLGLRQELVSHFFLSLGDVTTVRGGVCGEAGEAAQEQDFGALACHDFTDLANARHVVLWGKDPASTGPHLLPFVREVRARGGEVILIDPAPLRTAAHATRTVRIAPMGDGLLALAILRTLAARQLLCERSIERTENFAAFRPLLDDGSPSTEELLATAGVGRADLEHLCDLYGGKTPVATWIGWGLQRCSIGGENIRLIDALVLLSGHLGVPGGGTNFSSKRRRGVDQSGLASPTGRTLAAPTLGADLLALHSPALAFTYVHAANVFARYAGAHQTARAFAEREDNFVVVADAFENDTTRVADLVLPVKLMLEEDDLVGSYQHHHITRVRQVQAAPDGARGDVWIAQQLHARLGLPRDPVLDNPERTLDRMTLAWGSADPGWHTRRNPTQPVIPFADSFATPSGRARLITAIPRVPAMSPTYPLRLLTLASPRWQASQLCEAQQQGAMPCVVHPMAIDAAGLHDGDEALLQSAHGAVAVTLRSDERLHPSACLVRRGGADARGWGINALIGGGPTTIGECTAFYDACVRLVRSSQNGGARTA